MKEINLTQGYKCQVSDEDFERVTTFKWHAQTRTNGFVYAVRNEPRVKGKKRKLILLHRFLLGVTNPNIEVDHKDGDTLNNQRHNLRRANDVQSAQNARVRKDNTSGTKGVNWHKSNEKWVVRVQVKNKRIFVGLFSNLSEAAVARIAAAKQYHKEFAYEARA